MRFDLGRLGMLFRGPRRRVFREGAPSRIYSWGGDSTDSPPPGMPPEEAYGRVTNPERFRVLHTVMLEILDKLEAEFDVRREEGYGLDEELERNLRTGASHRQAHSRRPGHCAHSRSILSVSGSARPFRQVVEGAPTRVRLRRLRGLRRRARRKSNPYGRQRGCGSIQGEFRTILALAQRGNLGRNGLETWPRKLRWPLLLQRSGLEVVASPDPARSVRKTKGATKRLPPSLCRA